MSTDLEKLNQHLVTGERLDDALYDLFFELRYQVQYWELQLPPVLCAKFQRAEELYRSWGSLPSAATPEELLKPAHLSSTATLTAADQNAAEAAAIASSLTVEEALQQQQENTQRAVVWSQPEQQQTEEEQGHWPDVPEEPQPETEAHKHLTDALKRRDLYGIADAPTCHYTKGCSLPAYHFIGGVYWCGVHCIHSACQAENARYM